MNLSQIVRQIVAVVATSAILVGLTTAFAESFGWSDRLGLGVFFMAIGVGIVTMVHCHRLHNLQA